VRGRKTSVALQYVQKHKASSDTSVFWIHASSSDRLKNACSEIAKKLNLPGCGKSGVDGLRIFKDWLESEESGLWLIVLDNVDDMEVLYESGHMRLAEYLPRSERGSILLTTRFGKVGNSFTARRDIITLSAFSSEEAESLLTHRLGEEKPKSDQRRYVELANELERLPLSLVQAASCMFQNDVSISDYLELYRRSDASKIQLLSEGFEDHDVNTSIATTWVISFEYLSKHEVQAADLLSCMCMFSSHALPENLLPPGQDPVSFQKAIGTLKAYSFVSVFENSSHPLLNPKPLFNLHRLVRLATRNWLKMNGVFDLWTAKAIKKAAIECMQTDKNLNDSPGIFYSSPPIVLVPHINALIQEPVLLPADNAAGLPDIFAAQDSGECAEDNIICAKCTAVLLTFLSHWASPCDSLGLDEELIVARRNYALKMHIYDTEHAGTLASVRSLGRDYERSLHYEMADQFYREHLDLSRRMYGFADSRSVGSMQNLLRFYEDHHSCAARSLIHLECEKYTQQHEEHYLPEVDAWAADYRYELKYFLQAETHQERAMSKISKNWKYKDRTPLATNFFEKMQNYIHTQDGTILRWIKRLASIYTRNEKWTKAEWAYRLALAFGEKTACNFKKDRRRTRAKLKSLTLREAVHEAKEQESLATQQWQSAVEHGLP